LDRWKKSVVFLKEIAGATKSGVKPPQSKSAQAAAKPKRVKPQLSW